MKQLSLEEKKSIQAQLQAYVAKYPSQAKAVNSLTGVSVGTISVILNGKFDGVSDEMFARIRAQVAPVGASDWNLCETTAFRELSAIFEDARQNKNVAWIVGSAGIGKSTAARSYAASHENVFHICCSEDMQRGDFIRELAQKIGIKSNKESLRERLQIVTDQLKTLDNPLLIFDEGDKLMDCVFYYFISIYNVLEGHCGIVFLSTEYIKRRMENGLAYNKKGYDEIFSRVCRRFIDLTPVTAHEVDALCRANGLDDDRKIAEVVKDASTCRFDLRRVRKAVHKTRRISEIRG